MASGRAIPVAITGMAALFPGAPDLAAYWRNLVTGADAISEVPEGRFDAEYFDPGDGRRADRLSCRRGGFVDEFAEVDVVRFGIAPSSVPGAEPDQLIALQVAAAAIADAGGDDRLPDRDRVGVVLGRGGYPGAGRIQQDQRMCVPRQIVRTLGELLPELGPDRLARVRAALSRQLGADSAESAIGLVPSLAASRTANRLDLRGPAYTVDAACASSLLAVDQAVGELASGRCDVMLAGGVHHCHDITLWSVFDRLRALSPSERSRPFHREADGILIGEGTGILVLKRLADAQRDGDRIYAVVRGTGVAGDGRAAGLAAPDPGGQVRALRQAWSAAGIDPREPGSLGLLEAHGTATPAGDAAELATLAEVFGPHQAGERAVLGSVKSMIGHAMPAAGAAGLIKAALAVHHGMLLPTLHCEDPHPALAGTRFRTIGAAEPWAGGPGGGLRRAAVSAFGFGGINAHVVLEQPPSPGRGARRPAVAVSEPERVLALAADTPRELAALLAADGSPTAATPSGTGRARLGIVGPTARRRALAARVVAQGRPWRGRDDIWFTPAPLLGPGSPGRIAFVFPGLEAEFTPRVDGVAEYFGLPRPVAARPGAPVRAGDLGPHATGVFAVGRLLDGALRRMGVVPDAVAGHSVGEWNAMAMAGMYAREAVDGLLDSLGADGGPQLPGLVFAVLGTSARRAQAALAERADGRVVLSHDNAPRQCMVCGPGAEVAEFVARLRAEGVTGRILPFRSGFHTPMLAPYLAPITAAADRLGLRPAAVPVWSGTTAAPYPPDPAGIRALFVRHLLEPVRFRALVEALHAAGFRAFVQVGTGQLTSLVTDTLRDRAHLAVAAGSPRRDGIAQLRRVAVALWSHGAAVGPLLAPPSGSAPRVGGRPVRLALGSTLVSLGGRELTELRREFTRAGMDPAGSAGLDALADRFPPAAELGALLRETADLAAELITASTPGGGAWRSELRVSAEAMPHLLDHCFFPQRDGWPDLADRWPVVPATAIVQHLMDATERHLPGVRAVAVHHARFTRWVSAAAPVDVPVTGTPSRESGDRFDVAFGKSAHGTVEVAAHHPQPPAPWFTDPAAERAPGHTTDVLYAERWMFHGPAYQGVTELTAVGERQVRGVITAPAAPGALLDNVGQLLGYWIMATCREGWMVFPVAMRHIRFFGPQPCPGTRLECLVRIVSLTDAVVEADAQLVADGRVWAEITGWQDRRFAGRPETRQAVRRPERYTLSRPQPGGWVLLHDWWQDTASRDLFMRHHLCRAERLGYEQQSPRARGQWLLGRIAVKDAVRQWLWEHGAGPVFPAEIQVRNDPRGRPYVTGVHGRSLPELDVTLSHRAETGVALVRPRTRSGRPGAGIDVEEVAERPVHTRDFALGVAERRLLATAGADAGGPEALWFTRFWAAKEAVSKAEGTGLRGRPQDFVVTAARADTLRVAAAGRSYLVHCRCIGNPPGLPAREYVVAWTTGAGEEEDA